MPDRRCLLASGGALALLAASRAPQAGFDAVVAKPGASGPAGPRYASLGDALAAKVVGRQLRVWLGQGIWREKLSVTAPDVWITGEDRHRTVLSFDAAAGLPDPEGKLWGTSRTATLTVLAPAFRAERITIANGFDPAAAGRGLSSEGRLDQQAVALMLTGDSDRALLRDVDILGYQDTLFVESGHAVFDDSLVAGTVDFVFGGGAALLRRCEIRSRVRPGEATSGGFVAAPSTRREQEAGLVFDRCRLTRERGVADGVVYLGRPWRPTRSFAGQRYGDPDAVGMAAFVGCRMDAHIAATGWTAMGYNGADAQRHWLQPEEVRFAEWHSTGPGAAGVRRGGQMTQPAATQLLASFGMGL